VGAARSSIGAPFCFLLIPRAARPIHKKSLREKFANHILRRIYSWHLSCARASSKRHTTHLADRDAERHQRRDRDTEVG
jgi:hypothetical protein